MTTQKDGPKAPKLAQSERKQADRLVELVERVCELFHDRDRKTYAWIRSHSLTLSLRSRQFKSWLAQAAHQAFNTTIANGVLDEALMTLEGRALFHKEQREVFVRVGEANGVIYIDLADGRGGAIRVAADGWCVVSNPPIRFLRSRTMRPLVHPAEKGDIRALDPFVNVRNEQGRILVTAFLVSCFRPNVPTPILCLHGEQGSGKSTLTRVLRRLTDPSDLALRGIPRQEDDFFTATRHSHVIAYDNLSNIAPWLSDALCRLATGGGIGKRQNFSDDDEVAITAIRPLIINGIDNLPERADLAERCVVVELSPIDPSDRTDEESFWNRFAGAEPVVLAALLDALVAGLRGRHSVVLATVPRMADFARFQVAALPALGVSAADFLMAYGGNRVQTIHSSLDASVLASAVLEFMRLKESWSGEPRELLAQLELIAPQASRNDREWPKVANQLTKRLKRHLTSLRAIGLDVRVDGRNGTRRWVEIAKVRMASSVSSVSQINDADGADDAEQAVNEALASDEVAA